MAYFKTTNSVVDVLQESATYVNPQQTSPLFSHLPRELRDEIFAYALLDTQHDPFHRCFPIAKNQRHDIAFPLLLTCRAIYLETHPLPLSLHAVRFHHTLRNPMKLHHSWLYQLAHAQAADYTFQQTYLERATFASSTWAGICTPQQFKRLTIRLERRDWWTWENAPSCTKSDEVLALDPSAGSGPFCTRPTQAVMRGAAEARRGGVVALQNKGWGAAISSSFPALKELEMVFETFAVKKAQLEDVVRCAQTWEFEMSEGRVLRFAGVESGTWGAGVKQGKVEWQHGPFEVRVVRWKSVRR